MALITIFHFKNTLKRYIRQIFTYIGAILPQRRQGSCWQQECQILFLFSMTLVGGGGGDARENHVEDHLADGQVDDEDE